LPHGTRRAKLSSENRFTIARADGRTSTKMSEATMLLQTLTTVENLDDAKGMDAFAATVGQMLGSFGIDFFTFQDLPDTNRYDDFVFCRNLPEEWFKLYVKRQYVRIDPAFKFLRQTTEPFMWADAPYDAEREPRVLEFLNCMTDLRLDRGVVVPIPRLTGRSGAVWFGGSRAELNAHTLPALYFLAAYAFERLRQLRPPPHEKRPPLTPREREVLTWVAAGKTSWEIGEILNIAQRTVEDYAQNAVTKLGATNRTHAVALALHDHLISL
jgi:LuxR family quorum sensing-dependent transcriptional regulator